jgi:hypothetical protein
MYCPNPDCLDRVEEGRAGEYVDGVVTCPRCGATLVEAEPLPPLPLNDDDEVETVLVTADGTEAAVVRSLLDASSIPYLVDGLADHDFLGLAGAGVGIAGPGGLAIKVREVDLAAARELLAGVVELPAEVDVADDEAGVADDQDGAPARDA